MSFKALECFFFMELIELYVALPCFNRIVVVLAEAQELSRLSQLSFLKLGRPSAKICCNSLALCQNHLKNASLEGAQLFACCIRITNGPCGYERGWPESSMSRQIDRFFISS